MPAKTWHPSGSDINQFLKEAQSQDGKSGPTKAAFSNEYPPLNVFSES